MYRSRPLFLGAGLLLLAIALVVVFTVPDKSSWESELSISGIDRPPTVSATEADLADDELVIGVTVGDRHRAYRMTAFWPPRNMSMSGPDDPNAVNLRTHVVNDVIDGVPITVTHCVRTTCTRVLTDSNRPSPLPVSLGGFRDHEMLLLIDNERYMHSSPNIPFSDQPFAITEWRQWRSWYPDTDVYVGGPSVQAKPDSSE